MGNNEFNLIFVVGGESWTARHGQRKRRRRAGYHDRKKAEIDIPQEQRQWIPDDANAEVDKKCS